MDDRSTRQRSRFGRSRDFATTNIADLAGTDGPVHLGKLSDIIDEIDIAKTGQPGGSAVPKDVLIAALYQDAHDINYAAKIIAHDVLGFGDFFPAAAQRNPTAVLTAIDIILSNLAPKDDDDPATVTAKADRAAKFIAHGEPSDFVAKLQQHRAQIETEQTTENIADETGVESTKTIGKLVDDGITECNYLDVIFKIRYRDNAAKLGAWTSANHVEHAPVSAATKAKQAAAKAAKQTGGTTTNPTP